MRKFILITAMVLVSASAQASEPRSLTLASNEEPAAAPAAVDTRPADARPVDAKPSEKQPAATSKYVDRPAAVGSKPQPSADQCPCATSAGTDAPKTVKPRRRHESTEARVIYELHRHGIYW